jgi:hypothetical protein
MFLERPVMRDIFEEYAADLKRHAEAFEQGKLGRESFLTLVELTLANMKLASDAEREGEVEEN